MIPHFLSHRLRKVKSKSSRSRCKLFCRTIPSNLQSFLIERQEGAMIAKALLAVFAVFAVFAVLSACMMGICYS